MTAPVSRRQFLSLAGSTAAAGALLAACGGSDPTIDTSQFGEGDVGILNFFLALEHVEVAFYAGLVKAKVLSKRGQELIEEAAPQEEEHVKVLTKEIKKLGGKPASAPEVEAEISFDSEEAALEEAAELENAVAAGYLGQVLNLKGEEAQIIGLAIHSVEGKHAATFEFLRGESVTPDGPFAKPISEEEALGAAADYVEG